RAWDVLMKRLGYTGYVAQGGDWGAFIVDLMGVQELPGLLAIHTNYPGTVPAEIDAAAAAGASAPDGLSAEERRAYDGLVFSYKQVAYAKFMGTRPQTLYGIADSPVGLPPGFSTTATVTLNRPRGWSRLSSGRPATSAS